MNARDAGKAIPLIAAAFPPTRHPTRSMLVVGVRAVVTTAAGEADDVSTIKSSVVLVTLLSSHKFCLILALAPCLPPQETLHTRIGAVLFNTDFKRVLLYRNANQHSEGRP